MLSLVFVDLCGFIHDLIHNIPCCSGLAECWGIAGLAMWAHKAFMLIIMSAGRKNTLTLEYHPLFSCHFCGVALMVWDLKAFSRPDILDHPPALWDTFGSSEVATCFCRRRGQQSEKEAGWSRRRRTQTRLEASVCIRKVMRANRRNVLLVLGNSVEWEERQSKRANNCQSEMTEENAGRLFCNGNADLLEPTRNNQNSRVRSQQSDFIVKNAPFSHPVDGHNGQSEVLMMSLRHHDCKQVRENLADLGQELECEELDWDSYSATLENKLVAVGNFCWFVELPFYYSLYSQRSEDETSFQTEMRIFASDLYTVVCFSPSNQWFSLDDDFNFLLHLAPHLFQFQYFLFSGA